MIRQIRSMVVIALFLSITLSVTYHYAKPGIKLQQERFTISQLEEIVGDQYDIQFLSPTEYELLNEDQVVGRIEQVSTQEGYNGEIRFWLATKKVKSYQQVIGVRVIHHQETPGLGDKLDLAVSDWILSFNEQDLNSRNWDVKKYGGDFDQFTGATITPRAVVRRIEHRLSDLDQTSLKGSP